MSIIQKVDHGLDAITVGLAVLAGCLVVLPVILVCGDVFVKWTSGRTAVWVQEIVEFSLLWLTFLGSAWVLRENGHIKMDLVVGRLNPPFAKWLTIITSMAGSLICLVLAFNAGKVTYQDILTGDRLLTMMAPYSASINIVIPIGFLLLAIQFLKKGNKYYLAQ